MQHGSVEKNTRSWLRRSDEELCQPLDGLEPRLALEDMLAVLAREADLEWLMIDSTIVRAHQHAAGARRQKGGRMPWAWAGLAAG